MTDAAHGAPLDVLAVPLHGVQLVEASAGTGKTWTIAFLYLRLIVERELPIERILVVTFTRAATAELAGRLRDRLRQAVHLLDGRAAPDDDPVLPAWLASLPDRWAARERLAEALHAMDAAAISTIHGFCARMLQEFAFESGARMDLDVVDDERALVRRAVEDFWAAEVSHSPPQLVRHLVATKQGPDALLTVAMAAMADPTVPVLPPFADGDADDADVLAAIARWQGAFDAARDQWWADRHGLEQLLKDQKSLHKRWYQWKALFPMFRDVDFLFERGGEGPPAPTDALNKLTRRELARYTLNGKRPPEHPFFEAAERLWDVWQNTQGPVERWVGRLKRRMVEDVRERVRRAKERARAVSFTDLLLRLDAALADPERGPPLASQIRERYPAALIDEFQDTDPVQYRVFRSVHGGPGQALFLIGDPKQAIYGFRGADVLAYLQARERVDHRWTMTTNYRSDPGVIRAVAELYRGHPAPFVDPRIQFVADIAPRPGAVDRLRYREHAAVPIRIIEVVPDESRSFGPDGEMKGYWVKEQYPAKVAEAVVQALRAGQVLDDGRVVSPGDIAVLVRTNEQARRLHAELTKLGVPAALQGDASVLATAEASDVAALLAALADPGDPAAVRRALATRCVGLDGPAIAALADDEPGWERWVERFRRWRGAWDGGGFLLAFRRLIDEIDAPARLLAQTGGERSLTNLLHVGELLQQVATERRLHSAGLVHWLARALDDPKSARGELGQDADPIRLESDAGAVKLVTVHRSKGLEYPIVFLPFLAEGERPNDGIVRFHAHDGQLTLDIGSERRDAHAAIADDEGLAEASRLLYVALTRAKHQIVLFFGKFPRFGRSALSWLLFGRDCPSEGALDALEARVTAIPDFATPLEALGAGIRYGKLRTRRDPWSPPVVAPPPLAEFRPLRMQFRPWRVGSFSSLVAGSEHDPADGRDHDAAGRAASARDGDGPASPLLGWPRGAAPGTVLHGVLEALDFQAPPEARLATVAACLRRLGGPAGWDERLATALEVVCATPLGVGEPRLVDLDRAARRDELAFIIPAATEIDPSRLARCFEDHATSPHVRAYARRVGALGFPELRGFLKGYVDLVYRWDGRYGVVDYKSNHLGDRLDHYGCAALTEAMHHHDYVLQYHLYLLALHRQLRLRLPGYDFDRHVIGARYLFLRGMGGAPGAGVYADAPPRALIEALDACFEGA